MDQICPVDHVGRCDKCGRVHFIADNELETACGPDFGRDTLCEGIIRECNDHDALLAAYKLGGEEAAVALLFNNCRDCISAHWYGNILCCPTHT